MRAVIALVVIALVTGVFGMSQVMSKTELLKMRLVNQMASEIDFTKNRLKKWEGRVGKAVIEPYQLEYEYEDKDGKTIKVKEDFFTGGYGHRILKGEKVPEEGYTEQYWEGVFDKDFETAYDGALKLVGKDTNAKALGVITEMIFQMGYEGVSKFEKTLEYIKNEQWELASIEMLDSNWAIQTSDRAIELSKVMANIR
jgi:lysozyme